ncbi:hypothetical protein JL720_12254 [Aureococcus anophagefferens]|nr:hypothetical protein JL720_12254 [Aureococcus anophagefferens]
MAGHQRPLGLQWGAASCSPSDDSEVVVGSLGDGLGSVNLRTGELVASWRGAAAAPADAAVVCAADGATGAIAEGAAASTATPGKALHVCAWVGAGSAGSPSSSSARARGAKGGGVEVAAAPALGRAAPGRASTTGPTARSAARASARSRPAPCSSSRAATICGVRSPRRPASAAFAHAECQENPIDVLAACGATDVATGHRDGSIRVWRGVAAAAGAGGALSAYGVYHWHASAVGALDCGDRGDVLLSGGSEAVLVVWQLRRDETEDRSRDFLPAWGRRDRGRVRRPLRRRRRRRAADDAAADDAARGWRYSAKAKAAAVSGDRVVVAVPLEPPAAAVLVFAADDAAPLAWDVVAVPRALALSGAGGVLAAFPDGALLHLATEAPAAAPTVAVAPRRAGGVEVVEAGDGPSSSAALAFDALLRVDPARGADLDAPDTASGVCELLLAGAYY